MRQANKTIREKFLEPYYIEVDTNCYILKEEYNSDTSHHLSKGGDSKVKERTLGYFTSIERCITKIAQDKVFSDDKLEYTLKEVVNDYKKINEEIKNYAKEITGGL